MQRSWRIVQQAPGPLQSVWRRCLSTEKRFEPSDFAILRATSGRFANTIFLGPLTPGKRLETHKGNIQHEAIIGKSPRDVIETKTNNGKVDTRYRLYEVQLEDYVLLSKRLVTPIYPCDANLIVSLLDLHPESSSEASEPQIELLEAGTGHGSLTLHLSRAVHAANGASPKQQDFADDASFNSALIEWKKSRQAIVHSIEKHSKYSKHASKTVRQFRQGQYHGNIDFHTSDVGIWVKDTLAYRGRPFLTHAFLDLPGVQSYVSTAAAALKTNGTLIIFCPSITQITDSALAAQQDGTLDLDKVLELGVNGGTGGRLWDVRLVRPRVQAGAETQGETETDTDDAASEVIEDRSTDNSWHLICRPKVGDRIAGGGFLAVFRKKSTHDTQDTLQSDIA